MIEVETSRYKIAFAMAGLPKLGNQLLRGHWRTKHNNTIKWKVATAEAIELSGGKPPHPLPRAAVAIVRHSSICPDFDGLVIAAKPIIDSLVECGVLEGDSMKHIGQPSYTWEKAKPGAGKVTVVVEQI